MKLVIVSASTNLLRADKCLQSWGETHRIVVANGIPTSVDGTTLTNPRQTLLAYSPYLGTVPAFRLGVDYALDQTDADVIACLHDDLELLDPDWAEKTVRLFARHPQCGLAGFGGAIGLGDADIYHKPYDPMQLARIGFRSNLVDAEVHGVRSLLSERVACLDGFSQIGRREFWRGMFYDDVKGVFIEDAAFDDAEPPFTYFEEHGIVHHLYDSLLGAYAKRLGWEAWFLPIRCRHLGGQTAVGDAGYQAWAKEQIPGGDMGFWEQSHRRGFELFRDILPLRL